MKHREQNEQLQNDIKLLQEQNKNKEDYIVTLQNQNAALMKEIETQNTVRNKAEEEAK